MTFAQNFFLSSHFLSLTRIVSFIQKLLACPNRCYDLDTINCGGAMPYLLMKYLHVLAAIVAFGANVTYGIWITRASHHPDVMPFTLQVIKLIDDRLANPAYGLLLVIGLLMVFTVHLPLTTFWLLAALVLYALVVLIGLMGYTPTLRRQIQILESEGFNSPGYQTLARRGTILGVVLAILVMAIVFLMVVKPSPWA
ncbi:MAG TPA: hypothetical protein DCP92_02410 [Nitrospiraceae bacterium]|nr:hypothetical protein [Nitrospiraceae bacterium]